MQSISIAIIKLLNWLQNELIIQLIIRNLEGKMNCKLD